MRNVVGFSIVGHDNGTRYSSGTPTGPKCELCGRKLMEFVHNPQYRVGRRRRGDLHYTYDNVPIVSKRFRDFLGSSSYEGVKLLPFDSDPERFHLLVEPMIRFDLRSPKLERHDFCKRCGRYFSVATGGPNSIILRVNGDLPDGFYRTDLTFGDGDGQSPILLVGKRTREKMDNFGIKGILYEEVFSFENGYT